MDIPVINRISGFEAGINRLQNPSFVSRLFHLAGIEEISEIYSLWTWGALILAFLATFSSVIRITKLVFFRFWNGIGRPVISELPLVDDDENDYEDESCSSSSSDDEEEITSPFGNQRPVDEDFRVAGSRSCGEDLWKNLKFKLRRRRSTKNRFSWSDFATSQSVVKLWDGLGLGLGLGFENSSGSHISMWDLNKDEKISSFFGGMCQIPAVSITSPAVVVSAGLESSRNVALKVWDTRVGRQIPAVFAECQSLRRRIVGMDSGGVEKVYVMDEANSLAIRDMRNLNSPLKVLTESEGKTWWDADAVVVSDGDSDEDCCFGESAVNGRGSVMSRCRNAVISYLS